MTSPIKVGIIGVHPDKGWATTAHIPALKTLPDFRLTAVSHNKLETARESALKFGADHGFGTTDELVNDPNVDLVVVTVKVPHHLELVTKALEAGKSVFSEWPLGMNLPDAERMLTLAKNKNAFTAIGLQTRSVPAINFIKDLIKDGYAGEVLSVSIIGSGIIWGEEIPESYLYTLDMANGASMLHVPFAHTLDATLYALGLRLTAVNGFLSNSRSMVRIAETGTQIPLTAPDQIVVNGLLENGAALSAHFRGGLSRGTNFHIEINGSKGDLILTSTVGYVGVGGFTVRGAQGDEQMHELPVPPAYNSHGFEDGFSQSVGIAYSRIASDIRNQTTLSPTFEDAVKLHRILSAIGTGDRELHDA
ncbi:Gfo/Idh/MocA family protein [Phyllobacterium bourgognense]|uniref:Putative dehydrogenase n=1 Tax=Phyllobacterium bourgognense TaxID=314236 RepID=A0A368YQ41_9HYPH|nr:Gfo/Idh/MocA family oxidoreductase [Phyllobacterium bourgognense]RCW82341.1 putative dehydrogenase [Phyllobacterium bourgognense]